MSRMHPNIQMKMLRTKEEAPAENTHKGASERLAPRAPCEGPGNRSPHRPQGGAPEKARRGGNPILHSMGTVQVSS